MVVGVNLVRPLHVGEIRHAAAPSLEPRAELRAAAVGQLKREVDCERFEKARERSETHAALALSVT